MGGAPQEESRTRNQQGSEEASHPIYQAEGDGVTSLKLPRKHHNPFRMVRRQASEGEQIIELVVVVTSHIVVGDWDDPPPRLRPKCCPWMTGTMQPLTQKRSNLRHRRHHHHRTRRSLPLTPPPAEEAEEKKPSSSLTSSSSELNQTKTMKRKQTKEVEKRPPASFYAPPDRYSHLSMANRSDARGALTTYKASAFLKEDGRSATQLKPFF